MTDLCSYGCEKPGVFKLKNGKLCCSKTPASCPKLKAKHKFSLPPRTDPADRYNQKSYYVRTGQCD